MQVARYHSGDAAHWGFVDGRHVREGRGPFERAVMATPEELRDLLDGAGASLLLDDVRLLSPVPRPSKIIGLARNYRTHGPPEGDPTAPTLFGMVPSAIIGPGDSIVLPPEAKRVDWEAELAVVIG